MRGAGSPSDRRRLLAYPAVAGLLIAGYVGLGLYRIGALWQARHPAIAAPVAARWCRRLWPLLRLRVEVHGTPATGACVYVANHRSYLDIIVLLGTLGGAFLSRDDVRSWPLVGAVAKEIGCVFVARDDGRDRMRAARTLLRTARHQPLIVFPEGTTTGGDLPARFEPGLFRLLQRSELPVVPVTLRYSDRRAYWVEDLSVWQHLQQRVFTGPPLVATVNIGVPIAPAAHGDAQQLAAAVYDAVARPIQAGGEPCAC